MRCASWGHEAPSDKPHESLDRAPLGLDDQEVPCPAYLSDPHRQITPVISAAAWLSRWVEDNARGGNPPVTPAEAIILDEGENHPVYGSIRAEIMEYLSQTYGPVFVEDLIKHLAQPG